MSEVRHATQEAGRPPICILSSRASSTIAKAKGTTMFKQLVYVSLAITLTACSMGDYVETAGGAVTRFHEQLNGERYEEIMAGAGEAFGGPDAHDETVAFLSAVHNKLGNLETTSITGWHVNYGTDGKVVTLNYQSSFERGEATEQFVFRVKNDEAELIGYHINSRALIVNEVTL